MSEKVDQTQLIKKLEATYRHFTEVKQMFRLEMERLRGTMWESNELLRQADQLQEISCFPAESDYWSSTLLIAVLMTALQERNAQVRMLHKQVAAHTKKLSALNDRYQESDRQLRNLQKILDHLFAEVPSSSNLPDSMTIESLIEKLTRSSKDQASAEPRPRRKRVRSFKKNY